jgi:hypothetical protein
MLALVGEWLFYSVRGATFVNCAFYSVTAFPAGFAFPDASNKQKSKAG